MAKTKSPTPRTSTSRAAPSGSANPGGQIPTDERQRLIAEKAYFRAQARGFHGGDAIDDWLAAEREVNRLLPSPAQQKQELAAYRKLRGLIEKLLAESKDTLNADTIRQAIDDARSQMRQLGEYTADTIEKGIVSIEKEMLGATQRMGSRLENFSERSADLFYVWRDRGGQFLARAATAIGGWAQQVRGRIGQQTYRTGEMAAGGTLECTNCGERVMLETPAHVPLCPKCRKSEFRRVA
jgi:hypothetical protein